MSATAAAAPSVTRVNDDAGTFSERFPILFDPGGRLQKADKVVAVLSDYFGPSASEISALDIGCSTGIMTCRYAQRFGRVVGIDTDAVGVQYARRFAEQAGFSSDQVACEVADGCNLPFDDNSFDAAVCNQVYEHVDDHQALINEIFRVLRPGGACYFGCGTRHVLIEGHYKLPLLSWLPRPVADWYMAAAGRNARYDVTLLSYRNLRKLVRPFAVVDYTIDIIKRPERYAEGHRGPIRRFVSRWPAWLLQAILPIVPIHVWVLVKPDGQSAWAASFGHRHEQALAIAAGNEDQDGSERS